MLLTANQVSERIGYAYNTLINRIQFQPGFPRPIRLTPRGKLLWNEEEISEFITQLSRNSNRKAHG